MNGIETDGQHCLGRGAVLNGHYRIEGVLGEGGFGITYEAVEWNSKRRVAIKEYFPKGYAFRKQADLNANLLVLDGKEGEEYQRGLERFLSEARLLEQLKQMEGIVTILEHFTENQTAYIVMEYIDGVTLRQYIAENGPIRMEELLKLLQPVMCSLGVLHKKGFIHRDISPDNLMIDMGNRMHLIDFGAAKQAFSKREQTMTVILKNGYAPPEQYLTDGVQGAWTDVYAMSATIYMALTGVKPQESIGRIQKECLELPPRYGADITWWQWKALEMGLRVQISERYRSMEQLYTSLTMAPSIEEQETEHAQILTRRMKRKIKQVCAGATGEKEQRAIPSVGYVHASNDSFGEEMKKKWRKGGICAIVCILLVVGVICLTGLPEGNYGAFVSCDKVWLVSRNEGGMLVNKAITHGIKHSQNSKKDEMKTQKENAANTQERGQASSKGGSFTGSETGNGTGSGSGNKETKADSSKDSFQYIEEEDEEASFELGE